MWLAVLSDQLRVVGVVGRYPANYLIRNRLLPLRPRPCERRLWVPRDAARERRPVLPGLSAGYPGQGGTLAIRYSPVRHWAALLRPRATCMS